MRAKRVIIGILLFPCALIILGFFVQEGAFRFFRSKQLQAYQGKMEKILPQFLEDQKTIEELGIFTTAGKGSANAHDAGPYLNPMLEWDPPEKEDTSQQARDLASPAKEHLKVSEEVTEKLKIDPLIWLSLSDSFDYTPYDLTWMNLAQNFDHWDVMEAPPIRQMFGLVIRGKLQMLNYQTSYPMPNLKEIVTLAKIRLMKGVKEKNLLPALNEIRNLAKLSYSTELLVGELFATALLGTERIGYEYGVSRGLIEEGDWKPVPPEIQQRLKRMFMVSRELFSPLAPPELLEKYFMSGKFNVGRCVAIREGTSVAAAIDRHLGSFFPLERDFAETFEVLRNAALDPNNGCRLKDVRTYWKDPLAFRAWTFEWNETMSILEANKANLWLVSEMLSFHLPFYRKAAGLDLALMGTPEEFYRYDPPPPPGKKAK